MASWFEVALKRVFGRAPRVLIVLPLPNEVQLDKSAEQACQAQVSSSGFVCELAIRNPLPFALRLVETVALSAAPTDAGIHAVMVPTASRAASQIRVRSITVESVASPLLRDRHSRTGKYEIRWLDGGRHRQRTFTRKRDAQEAWNQIQRLKETDGLGMLTAGEETLG